MQNVLSLNRSGITGSVCSLLQLAILSRSSFSLIIPWVFQNKSSVCLKEGSSVTRCELKKIVGVLPDTAGYLP